MFGGKDFSVVLLSAELCACSSRVRLWYVAFLLFVLAGTMHQPLQSELQEYIICELCALFELCFSTWICAFLFFCHSHTHLMDPHSSIVQVSSLSIF